MGKEQQEDLWILGVWFVEAEVSQSLNLRISPPICQLFGTIRGRQFVPLEKGTHQSHTSHCSQFSKNPQILLLDKRDPNISEEEGYPTTSNSPESHIVPLVLLHICEKLSLSRQIGW